MTSTLSTHKERRVVLAQVSRPHSEQRTTKSQADLSGSSPSLKANPAAAKKLVVPRSWDVYFQKKQPRQEVARLMLQLHQAGNHEAVIAAIQAALIHGQSQPWMYDVLALSLKIAGHSPKEIERVLLSRLDFTAADVPNMLYSAACLTRFGAEEEALQFYRLASRLEPARPEPYVLGLRLAQKRKDYDALKWAVGGILTYAWTRDHVLLHQMAEDAALNAQQTLRKQGKGKLADSLAAAVAEARQRDLVLKLTWSGDGDLDLIVEEPLGTICSAAQPASQSGGVLLHDGYGPKPETAYEEYVCAYGVPGDYRVRVDHVLGNIVGKRARLTITRYRGTANEDVKTISVTVGEYVTVKLEHGRRQTDRSRKSTGASAK